MTQQVVIVGAGQAAQSVIETLRAGGHTGAITLIGDEGEAPYQRPPLSKAYLLGKTTLDRLKFKPDDYYANASVDTHFADPAVRLDRDKRCIVTASGAEIGFDKLVIATGSTPRRLPAAIGGDLDKVYTIRSAADARAIAHHFVEGQRVLIVGGGYIGLEAAAVARQRGLKTHLVEFEPRVLSRVACQQTSDFIANVHTEQDVDLRTGTGLNALEAMPSGAIAAHLSDGASLEIDFVVLGIGVAPNTAFADTAGLEMDNGICVDAFCATSDPTILAAGDCASFPYTGPDGASRRLRLESVHNAIAQGAAAARTILGERAPYAPVPWFWSDQYDVKMQIVGLGEGHDTIITRAGKRGNSCSHWYFAGATLLAVDALGDPRAYMMGKRLLENAQSPSHDAVADQDAKLV